MNSKVLTNEEKLDFGDGITLYFGSQKINNTDVISITVKGKFKPIIDTKDYKPLIKNMKDNFLKHGQSVLDKCDWINNHYIFTTDFTECGITKNNTCKWKFQAYVSPREKKGIDEFRLHIIKLGEYLTDVLEGYMQNAGFEFKTK